jgi:hypothetical protein
MGGAAPGPVMCRVLVLFRYAWVSPATFAGLLLSLVALAFGAKARVVEGAVEIAGGRIHRCFSMLPGSCRFGAMTIGHVIIGTDHETLAQHRLHEHVHVRQYERWGVLFFPLYVISSLLQIVRGRDPYLDNTFEREAFAESSSCHLTPGAAEPGPASARSRPLPPDPGEALKLTAVAHALTHARAHPSTGQPT